MTKEQWDAIKNKDRSYDGSFVYVLKSTGVICRPSCEKKLSEPENIMIFHTCEDAKKAGYRPCKRCHPELEDWKGAKFELAQAVEREIKEGYLQEFSLEALAEKLHVNKFYLLRTFRDVSGTTPLQYHNQFRSNAAEQLLQQPELSIGYIALETGFNSASHFSRVFRKTKQMSPSEYREVYFESLKKD